MKLHDVRCSIFTWWEESSPRRLAAFAVASCIGLIAVAAVWPIAVASGHAWRNENSRHSVAVTLPSELSVRPGDYVSVPIEVQSDSGEYEICLHIPPDWTIVGDVSEPDSRQASRSCRLGEAHSSEVHFFTLQSPRGALADVYDLVLSVNADTYALPIRVNPVLAVRWDVPKLIRADPADPTTVTIHAHNEGNVQATMRVTPSLPSGWNIFEFAMSDTAGDVNGVIGPQPKTLSLAPGETGSLTWEFPIPVFGNRTELSILFRAEASVADSEHQRARRDTELFTLGDPEIRTLRTSVALLPPPPSLVPTLSTIQAPATVAVTSSWTAHSTSAPSSRSASSSFSPSHWQLTARLPAGSPTRPPGFFRVRARGPALGRSPGEHTFRPSSKSSTVQLQEFVYAPAGAWELRTFHPGYRLSPLLTVPDYGWQWRTANERVAIMFSAPDFAPENTERAEQTPRAALHWSMPLRIKQHDTVLSMSHRGGSPNSPPAYGLDWELAWPGKRRSLALSLAASSFGPLRAAAWGGRFTWGSPADGESISDFQGGFQWIQRSPSFAQLEGMLPIREGVAWLRRSQHATRLWAGIDYREGISWQHRWDLSRSGRYLPVWPHERWSFTVGTERVARRAGDVGIRLQVRRNLWKRPTPDEVTRNSQDELRWSLHRGANGRHLTLSGRWLAGVHGGWEHRLTVRRRSANRTWWYATVAQHTFARGTGDPDSHGQWEAGIGRIHSHRTGWHTTASLRWTAMSEGERPRFNWSLSATSPAARRWRWRLAASGGSNVRIELTLQRDFQLPLPLPPSLGQVVGHLDLPPEWERGELTGTGQLKASGQLKGAVLSLGPYEVSTDANGYFRFPALPPGRYPLRVEELPPALAHTLVAPAPQTVEVEAGTNHYDVALVPVATLEGRITMRPDEHTPQPTGHTNLVPLREDVPLASAFELEVTEMTTKTRRFVSVTDGTFHITGLTPGVYQLRVFPRPEVFPARPTNGTGRAKGNEAPLFTKYVELLPGAIHTTVIELPKRPGAVITYSSEEPLNVPQPKTSQNRP